MTARWILPLAALTLAIGAPVLAQTPGPATKFSGFLCQIDLGDAGFTLPAVVTGNTEKLCANGAQGGNIRLTCKGVIPGWTGGNVNKKDVPCQISGAQCNLPGALDADQSMLKIDASGNATLTCQSKANQR